MNWKYNFSPQIWLAYGSVYEFIWRLSHGIVFWVCFLVLDQGDKFSSKTGFYVMKQASYNFLGSVINISDSRSQLTHKSTTRSTIFGLLIVLWPWLFIYNIIIQLLQLYNAMKECQCPWICIFFDRNSSYFTQMWNNARDFFFCGNILILKLFFY